MDVGAVYCVLLCTVVSCEKLVANADGDAGSHNIARTRVSGMVVAVLS